MRQITLGGYPTALSAPQQIFFQCCCIRSAALCSEADFQREINFQKSEEKQ